MKIKTITIEVSNFELYTISMFCLGFSIPIFGLGFTIIPILIILGFPFFLLGLIGAIASKEMLFREIRESED